MPVRQRIHVRTRLGQGAHRIELYVTAKAIGNLELLLFPGREHRHPVPSIGPASGERVCRETTERSNVIGRMPSSVKIEIDIPADLTRFRLPDEVQERLHVLLDRLDNGQLLTDAERREAEGLVDLADLLSLLRLRAEPPSSIAG